MGQCTFFKLILAIGNKFRTNFVNGLSIEILCNFFGSFICTTKVIFHNCKLDAQRIECPLQCFYGKRKGS